MGRGFSMNHVQNGADPLWMGDLSAPFVLSAPTTATPCKLAPIEMAGDCSAGIFTSRVRTNMTTIAFIPNRRQDFSGPLIKIGLLNAKRLLTSADSADVTDARLKVGNRFRLLF